ncbi:hypothetical protein HID58_007077, partial [Brassica napus]
ISLLKNEIRFVFRLIPSRDFFHTSPCHRHITKCFYFLEMNLVEARVNGERSKTYVICGNERVCNWTCIFNEHFTRGRCRHLYCYCFR